MNYRYNVMYCKDVSESWTPTAIDCYKIGCMCSKCNLHKIYFKDSSIKCKMKDTVIELVRKFGIPQPDSKM